ncbi:kinase domain-containing protein [Lasiosphaeria miniovina]|uniref:Kinase domain-containing protein n=1 Tax=Lasiosphaeria miniovina TaxID=1954250 RepID=A0AA40BI51_9PEZI|nr:kinase domain-containing protein [Lasiosphaeria miniovina]KAK0734651.1 kinase domain-containing protein [Lasiosphaeria miniovina]
MPLDFEKQSYWHARFAHEENFEWLVPSATFTALIEPHLTAAGAAARILHLGIGTSDLHIDLRRRGFERVANVDYEPLALERGRQLEEQVFGDVRMGYLAADVIDSAGEGKKYYDLAIDKCTADAVACGRNDAVLAMAENVRQCLSDSGVWISLSYSASRYDLDGGDFEGGLPFEVEVVGKIPTPKQRVTDPDVFYWCYLLRPKRL